MGGWSDSAARRLQSKSPVNEEAHAAIKEFVKPLNQLLQFYDPEGYVTPQGFSKCMKECGLAPLQPLIIKLAVSSEAGEECRQKFLKGQVKGPMEFGLTMDAVMLILAQIAGDLNKKQKTKSSLKKTATDLVKRMFTKNPHNIGNLSTVHQ